jgi:hypothetical protein
VDRDLTSSVCSRSAAISSNGCRPSWASCRSSRTSGCDSWSLFLVPDLTFFLQLYGNPLPTVAELPFDGTNGSATLCARRVNEILAATTHIGMIRKRATEICIGLQSLELPAFVTLQIVDAAVHENSIRMWAKWELITAVKHFRDRRARST